MMMENTKLNEIEKEISELKNVLEANTSDIGDYKITKTYEARLLNKPDPYDTNDIIARRQAVRDRIGELEAMKAIELAAIDKQETL